MSAFVFALNDSDERVRAKAADEIGDQVRRNRCICGPSVIQALRCSLADCDSAVRREARQSLKACGFKVVDATCSDNCGDGCGSGCGGSYCPAHYAQPATQNVEPATQNVEPAMQVVPPVPVDDSAPELTAETPDVESVSWAEAIPVSRPHGHPIEKLMPIEPSYEMAAPGSVPPPAPVEEPQTFFRGRLHKLIRSGLWNANDRPLDRSYGMVR